MLLLLWKYDLSIQKDWVWIEKYFWIWMFLMDVFFYFWYPYDPMCLDFWYPYVPSNVQFGQDKKTQFLDKLQIFWKKMFLGHWDIGIRMNLQILNFWRVWENFEVSGKQRFGQHRTMVRRNRKYVQRWSGEYVVPGFLWFQPGLTNSNSNILGHLQKNQ